jgi:hypothetical protein
VKRARTLVLEGVRYYPFRVRFRLASGQRRRWIRWSPGFPWVQAEVQRELQDTFGIDGVKSVSISDDPRSELHRS